MSRVIAPFAQFFDGNGDPLANGFLRFLESRTNNTLKTTYADANQTIPNSNPVQLDAEGRCPNVFGQGIYRVDLYTYNPVTGLPGTLIQSFDPVQSEYVNIGAGGNFSDWDETVTYEISEIVIRNGKYYRSIQTGNVGQDPETHPDYWEQITFLRYWNTNVTYLTDDVVIHNSALYFSLADANKGNIPLSSPAWWSPVGSGTTLLNWQESGTTLQPIFAGYNLGAVGNEVGSAYINNLGIFPLTPSTDPTNDYDVANKQYVDTGVTGRMNWIGDWIPGTYEINDVVRDDNWTMVAIAQTDERPAPQPTGDAQWVRDLFSPPAFSETSANESVLYIGQRYDFTQAFLAVGMRVWFPTATVGLEYKIWAVYNPTGDYRIVNLYPGDVIDETDTDKWIEIPFGQIYVQNIVDIIVIFRSPTSLVNFTYEWTYSKSNGDPPSGFIYHQGGSEVDEIRVHQEDSGAVDRTVFLDNIGPGSTITMDSTSAQWDVLEASKTGSVYTFIVDPGARSDNATSNFTFEYYGSSPISYVYNTNLYSADARIQGYFGNTYDPDNVAYINENGYGLDIEIQSVIISNDWEVVSQPSGVSTAGGGQILGYWEEVEEYFRPITDNIGYLGDSTHNIQGISLSDGSTIQSAGSTDIATIGSGIITFNNELIYSANNGPLAGFRNKIINPFFDIWQRYTGSPFTTPGTYTADRKRIGVAGGATLSIDQATGTVIDSSFETNYGCSCAFTTDSTDDAYAVIQERIEDVRSIFGTITVSIVANIPLGNEVAIVFRQTHGSGGSSTVVTEVTPYLVGTGSVETYTRTVTIAQPGTLGTTDNYLQMDIWLTAGVDLASFTNLGHQPDGTVVFYAWQVEPGPYATPFEKRRIKIEQQLCYRYYQRFYFSNAGWQVATGYVAAGNYGWSIMPLYTAMRSASLTQEISNLTDFNINVGSAGLFALVSLVFAPGNTHCREVYTQTNSGALASYIGWGLGFRSAAANGYLGFSAEL